MPGFFEHLNAKNIVIAVCVVIIICLVVRVVKLENDSMVTPNPAQGNDQLPAVPPPPSSPYPTSEGLQREMRVPENFVEAMPYIPGQTTGMRDITGSMSLVDDIGGMIGSRSEPLPYILASMDGDTIVPLVSPFPVATEQALALNHPLLGWRPLV